MQIKMEESATHANVTAGISQFPETVQEHRLAINAEDCECDGLVSLLHVNQF